MPCDKPCPHAESVTLAVNGQAVELNGFVAEVIRETVLGLLRPLRGVDEIRSVDLRIEPGR